MKTINVFILISLITLLFTNGTIDAKSNEFKENDIENNLEILISDFNQQKVYLHTDKDAYLVGEQIWFAAYLVNSTNHMPDASSTNLNVELLNSSGNFIDISLFQLQEGYSYGNLFIPDSLTEGSYYLRAYTDWMKNFDEEFYYQKELHISNPIEEDFVRLRQIWNKRRFNSTLEDKQSTMQFAVFPEGGNIVADLNNRVAFKATNALGLGKEANGKVADSEGNTILEFNTIHDGMGVFEFTPTAGEKYSATINFKNGEQISYSLPEVLSQGYLLKANNNNDRIEIEVESNFNPENYNINSEVTIAAHTRGKLILLEKGDITTGTLKTSFAKEQSPTGICHITVFDGNMLPVAERLIFINHNDIAKAQFKSIETSNVEDLEIVFDNYANDDDVWGSYSMSIINQLNNDIKHTSNIASYLLLENDLGSSFKNPWYYLSNNTEEINKALDLLMMTHGWRRFNWSEVLAEDMPELKFERSTGITMSGKLITARDNRPLNNIHIEMSIDQNGVDIYTTETSNGGNFAFKGLHYIEAFDVTIIPEVTRQKPNLDLDIREYDKASFSKSFLTRPKQNLSRGDNWSRTSRPETEVEPYIKPDFKKESKSPYGTPDQTIYIEDLPSGHNQLGSALRGRLISIGSGGSFHSSTEPLYMIDGSPTSRQAFNSLNPQNVERVEVFRGSNAAVFGVRGANGVILAYTRTTLMDEKPVFEFEYYGYNKTKEFYRSKINTDIYQDNNINQTIYWEPQIMPCENGKAEVELPENINLDGKTIIIEGIDNKGRITFSKIELN